MIQSLPEKQRKTVISALRGVIAGMARDPAAQETLRRVTLHIDASRNAIICVPTAARAVAGRASGIHLCRAPDRAERPDGDAAARRAAVGVQRRQRTDDVGLPVREPRSRRASGRRRPGHSIDECFEKAPICPAGRLDSALSCCPQACKDAYRRERARGTDAETATIKVIFGDDAGAASCVPGMPKRG